MGVPQEDRPKLKPLHEGLEKLRDKGLTAASVVAALHK
jgi:hypothetical protein